MKTSSYLSYILLILSNAAFIDGFAGELKNHRFAASVSSIAQSWFFWMVVLLAQDSAENLIFLYLHHVPIYASLRFHISHKKTSAVTLNQLHVHQQIFNQQARQHIPVTAAIRTVSKSTLHMAPTTPDGPVVDESLREKDPIKFIFQELKAMDVNSILK